MTDLSLGWAVVGKWPGSRDEQSVIAASATPFTRSQLHRLVAQSSPGSPHGPAESGAAALPWVWLANARLHEVSYLCIAVSSWSTAVDAYQRAIAHTRYFYLPLEDFLATSMTLAGLYATVAEVQPPWEDRSAPFSHDKLTVPQRTGDVTCPSPLSPEVAAVAAAQVVEQPVALLGGRSLGLDARLAALDSIRELLPGGALRWLTTACWATGNHPIRLFFTDQARGTDLTLPLRGARPAPTGPAGQYANTLLRLRDRYGHGVLVDHLRTLIEVQEKDFTAIQGCLKKLDLVGILEEAARSGRLVLADVRELRAGGAVELTDSQRNLILGQYLAKATPHDIREGRSLLATHWDRALDGNLTKAVATALNTRAWRSDELGTLAELAEAAGALQPFLCGLRPLSGRRAGTQLEVVWNTVLALSARTPWQTELAAFVAAEGELALRAGEVLRSALRPPDPFYTALQQTGNQSIWGPISRIYWPEQAPPATEADVALVMDTDPAAIPRLLHRRDLPFENLLAGLLPYLDHKRHLLGRPEWEQALRSLPVPDILDAARLDLILYRAGRPPVHPLIHSVDYVAALTAWTTETGISLTERSQLVERVVKALPAGWLSDGDNFVSTMDALWQLGTAPDGADQSVPPLLVDLLKRELKRRPGLLDDERLRPWADYFRQLGVLHDHPAPGSFAALTPDTPLEAVADLVANLATARRPPKVTDLAADLAAAQWNPLSEEWAYLVIAVQYRLHRLNHGKSGEFCGQLLEELSKVLGKRRLTDLTGAMAGYARTMATGLQAVEERYPESIEANRPEVSDLVQTLEPFRPKSTRFNFFKQRSEEPAADETPTAELTDPRAGFQLTDRKPTHGR